MKKTPKKVIVRKSYYTFSREYPAGRLPMQHKRRHKGEKKRTALRVLLFVLLFAVVFAGGFFLTDLSLKISGRPIAEENTAVPAGENGERKTMLNAEDGLQALCLPTQTIRDRAAVKESIRRLKRNNCNSVVLDFKTREGKLLYASLQQPALLAGCSLYSNETVRNAIKQFQNASISVIARVYCFEDPLIAAQNPAMAVTYLDTQVPWLDKKEEAGGKPWLNPYSSKARSYLLAILKELNAFNLGGVILESVCFPEGDNLENASFAGASGGASRNGVLRRFLNKAAATQPDSRFVLTGQTIEELQLGSDEKFDGFLTSEKIDGVYLYTAGMVDPNVKYADYLQQINTFVLLESRLPAGQLLLLDIPQTEYNRAYGRTLRRNSLTRIAFSELAPTDSTE